MAMTMHLDIVSAESEIYSGRAERLFASGTLGDIEIAPNHAPLLTALLPGPVRIREQGGKEHVVYVTGGILEVQPQITTILADTVVRAKDFNEAEAIKAKEEALEALKDRQGNVDYAKARAELIRAAGLLKAIEKERKKGRH